MTERWLEALSDAADGALIIDQQQRILFCNQAATEIIGHNGEEIAGSFCYTTLEGHSKEGLPICCENCHLAAAAAKGRTVKSFDMSVKTQSADIRWLNVSTVAWPSNGTGKGTEILHLFRDVTEQKQREQLLDRVLEAAKTLQSGGRPITSASQPAADPGVELTDREQEVLSLLAEGIGTRGIARALVISPSTTRNHIRNIMDKFQVHSRLEAVLYALRQGLVTLE